jgi:DNA-binding CsgD family transcriptional regulator
MHEYLDELEARYSDDLDVRLRLAIGRYGTAEQTTSVAGEWNRFAVLLDSLQYSKDPLVSTSFLALAAGGARIEANYALSRELADQAVRMCRELRFDLGLGASLLHRAAAELGLRAFGQAQRSLSGFARTLISREDPFYLVEWLTLKARLHAYRGNLEGALATSRDLAGMEAPPRALGSYLAARSILLAATGDGESARITADEASRNGSNIEMIYCTKLGCAIADDVDGDSESFRVSAPKIVIECSRASYVDGLVLAYRVYPRLLQVAAADEEAEAVLGQLLAKSRDHELARLVGVELRLDTSDHAFGGLTRRERQVLSLLSEGMTNDEIAARLFIARSTAKVHVHHIFEKLGVRTRLQAALKAPEILEPEET